VFGLMPGACSGDDGGSASAASLSTFDNPTAMGRALTDAGIACDGFTIESSGDTGGAVVGPTAAAEGQCDSDGDQLSLAIYSKTEEIDQILNTPHDLVCGIAISFGVTEINYAYGANWFVGGMSDDPVPYADALGGQSGSFSCES
jgi:hypothetical protein